jgi:hypothetical protein
MDIPISLLNWEVFLPERYKVKDFGGDVIAANRVPEPFREDVAMRDRVSQQAQYSANLRMRVSPGQIGGYVTDPTGTALPSAQIIATSYDGSFSRTAVSDASGQWLIVGLPSGNYKVMAEHAGFRTVVYNVNYNADQPAAYNFPLSPSSVSEVVEVNGQPATDETSTSMPLRQPQKAARAVLAQNASENVMNLQKRVAGVLPVPIDVPHAGTSFSFVRPLVLDEETKVTFTYKSR